MNLPVLVGVAEVADLLGVSKQRIGQLDQENARFPKPVVRLACGPIWSLDDIEVFAAIERPVGAPKQLAPERETTT